MRHRRLDPFSSSLRSHWENEKEKASVTFNTSSGQGACLEEDRRGEMGKKGKMSYEFEIPTPLFLTWKS